MFNHDHYVCAIKGKAGEMAALAKIPTELKDRFTPLIDIPRPNTSKGISEVATHLEKIARTIDKSWGSKKAIFVDLFDLPLTTRTADDMHPMTKIWAEFNSLGLSAIPVTGIDRDSHYHVAVRKAARLVKNGACIRLLIEDMELPAETKKNIENVLEELKLPIEMIDIILDFRCIRTLDIKIAEMLVLASMKSIPMLRHCRTLTLLATNLPQSISEDVAVDSIGNIQRKEVELWRCLKAQNDLKRIPTFGDYGTVHPDFVDIDPRIYANTMGPKIIYTVPNEWLVLRGSPFQKHPLGYAQYYELANNLIGRPEYAGSKYSFGDMYAAEKAAKNEGPGTPKTWITASINHHITFILEKIQIGKLS